MDEFCEDIEMMETDDNYIQTIDSNNDFVNKRDFNAVFGTNSCVSNSDKSPKIAPSLQSRHVLKAKRVLPKKSSNESIGCFESNAENKLICVLDTNILLSNLIELKNFIICEEKCRQTSNKVSKVKSIIIPWIVVQELDHMKSRKIDNKSKSVVNVIHFINEQLKKTNGLVKGENESQNTKSNQSTNSVEVETNDDKILNCCLKFKCSANNVLLVTNDLNLCNKALMNAVNAMNWKEFYDKFNEPKVNFVDNNSDEDIDEPKAKRLAKTSDNSPKKLRLSLIPKISRTFNTSTHSKAKPTTPDTTSTSTAKTSSSRKLSPIISKRKLIKSPTKTLSKKIDNLCKTDSNNSVVVNDCPLKYDEWIRFRDECEQKLLKFVENIYKQIWDKDWRQMLEIDVNNTNLKDIIRLLRKEWFANFSDHFNRDKKVKTLIDKLHTNIQKSDANYHLFYNNLRQLIDLVQQKTNGFEDQIH